MVPYRLTRDNSQDNLIPLCRKHHRWVETIFVETEQAGVPDHAKLLWWSMLKERQLATAAKIREVLREHHA
jgi:hypothetical protein